MLNRRAVIFAGCLFIFTVFSSGCGREKVSVSKKETVPVEVAMVQEREVKQTLNFIGDIKGRNQVNVYPKVTGKLIEYKVNEGDSVKKGEVIALIDRDETGFTFEPAPVESPLSGIVAKIYSDRGDNLTPQRFIAVVADMDEVKVKIEIVEVDYPKVKVGQVANITVDAYPGREFVGKLSKFSALVSPATHTATAEITIPNSEHLLVPGMFARITLFVGERKTLVAPRDAILRLPGTGVYYCFTVQENEAKKVFIELGIQKDNQQEITKGLKQGDLVIVVGQGILKTGSAVEIKKTESLEK